MKNPAIILDKVTKEYYLEKPRTMKKWFKTIFSPFEKFTVVDNFSLTINKGEFILLTGSNGSGKTTLLKLISGITTPDQGDVKTFGRVVPLIELGAGFNFELTGRENIITNATILGITKTSISRIIPKIIRFSGLKNFIDIPLKRYSSGMISRLAFSIAIFSSPDILLLDEVFSVGDKEFKEKSFSVLRNFNKKGVTIVLSTHLNFVLTALNIVFRKIELTHSNL